MITWLEPATDLDLDTPSAARGWPLPRYVIGLYPNGTLPLRLGQGWSESNGMVPSRLLRNIAAERVVNG